MNYFSRALRVAIFLLLIPIAYAEVDPPNYDFSLDQFKVLMPGQPFAAAEKTLGKAEMVQKRGAHTIYKFYMAHIRYKFPVLVQASGGKITDFYARLPAYFLHDIFHQSLINRWGKQDIYRKTEEQAIYVWNNENGARHIYSGACSITCFPIFYAVVPVKVKNDSGQLITVLETMHKQEKWKTGAVD